MSCKGCVEMHTNVCSSESLCWRMVLIKLHSSFQNVNVHRTAADALQTVPAHLWQAAVTWDPSLSLFLCLLWTHVLCFLTCLGHVPPPSLPLPHTSVTFMYIFFNRFERAWTWSTGCRLSRFLRNQTIFLHSCDFTHLAHSGFHCNIYCFSVLMLCNSRKTTNMDCIMYS